jgi:glycosyltransferase involved in cell wall biosynthesis
MGSRCVAARITVIDSAKRRFSIRFLLDLLLSHGAAIFWNAVLKATWNAVELCRSDGQREKEMTFGYRGQDAMALDRPLPAGGTDGPTVLHVVESLSGGVATALEDYLRSTPECRHVILSHRRTDAPTGDKLDELASEHLALPHGHLARVRAIRRQLKRLRPDVVHAHSSFAGAYTRLTAGPWRPSVVYTPHCFAFERTDVPMAIRAGFWLAEAALGLTGGYVAASSPREAGLARRLSSRGTVVYVPCSPHIPMIEPAKPVRRQGRDLRVMMAGRLAAQKDPEFFARAARASRQTSPDTQWIWVGGGEPLYERLLRSAGVQVTGWLPRTESLQWLRTADVYVHTAAWEATGLSILEAAALGLPILARDIPATRSLGLSRLSETPEALAIAVHQVNDEELLAELRLQSHLLLERHRPVLQQRALQHVYHLASDRHATSRRIPLHPRARLSNHWLRAGRIVSPTRKT